MADTIKGLTIRVGADTKEFEKGLKKANTSIRSTSKEATELQKSLALKFDEGRFAEAQKLAQKAIADTETKAESLKKQIQLLETSEGVDPVKISKYRAELIKTESSAVQLKKKLEEINQIKFDALANKFNKVGVGITTAGKAIMPFSAAAAALNAALTKTALDAVSTATELKKLSQQTGISAEALQEMRYVANQTNVDFDTLQKGFVKAREALGKMSKGEVSNVTIALSKLGLEFESFKTADEYFYGVIDALSNVGNEVERAALANDLFRAELANKLMPVINAGGEALAVYAEEFKSLGVLTDEQVDKLADFNNTINRLKTTFANLKTQIGEALLPVVETFAYFLEDKIVPAVQKLLEWFKGLSDEQLNLIFKVTATIAVLSPLLLLIGKLTTSVGSIISLIPKLGSVLSVLAANPIIAIIGLIATLLTVLYTKNEQFRGSINNLIGTLSSALAPVLNVVMQLISSLLEALMPIVNILGNVLAQAINILVKAFTPLFKMLELISMLLEPLINVMLIPLQLQLKMLAIPLQLLGALLEVLSPLFEAFNKVVEDMFNALPVVINPVMEFIENAVNSVIDFINSLLKGINSLTKHLGFSIGELEHVKLDAGTYSKDVKNEDFENNITNEFDSLTDFYGSGNITNNDYDYRTQNVTVVVENYAEEVNVDDLVRQINIKLAEVM